MISFIGNLPGLAVRLSLVLAFLDWAAGDEVEPYDITARHFGRATRFVETYALPMARRAYTDASLSKSERAARRLMAIIREQPWERFTSREVLRFDRSGLATVAELNPALALLKEGEVIRALDAVANPKGGGGPFGYML